MSIPLYGQNKAGDALKSAVNSSGYKEITVITAGDASHTLSESDAGIIFINCAVRDTFFWINRYF